MTNLSVCPEAIEIFHLEAPLSRPRRNSFGEMRARPALLVRLLGADGAEGWGEVFCNWPSFAAPHREKILREILTPLSVGKRFGSPSELWQGLVDATRRLVIQANEPGPFEQAIAGLDMAAWDMVARRANLPLHQVLGDKNAEVPVYASALTSETMANIVPDLSAAGWLGYKIKVGFGIEIDCQTLQTLRDMVAPDAKVMVDANQAWDLETATAAMAAFERFDLAWLEEPLLADRPVTEWRRLSAAGTTPLAAGENVRGFDGFIGLISSGAVRFIQPDAIKWGGLSGLMRIRAMAEDADVAFAPHYLGSGIGLLATAHAAKALGAAWLEVDKTENPLRDMLLGSAISIESGMVRLTNQPGIGFIPSSGVLKSFAAA